MKAINKIDKEKILLDALNTFGSFTSVDQEFNYNQLEVIYEAMSQVFHIAPVSGLLCGTCTDFKIVGKVFVCKKCGKEQKSISS